MRSDYGVDLEGNATAEEKFAVCRIVIDAIRPIVRSAHVDGVSDFHPLPTQQAATALERIHEIAPTRQRLFGRGEEKTCMAVPISADNPIDYRALCDFAPYSIHVVFFDEEVHSIFTSHDCSYSMHLELTEQQSGDVLEPLQRALPEGVGVNPLKPKRRSFWFLRGASVSK